MNAKPPDNLASSEDVSAEAGPVSGEGQFLDFAAKQAEWSQATFGSDEERGPIGPLKHLAKEVQEALANIQDEMEYVDCFFLVLDASRRAKIPASKLLELAFVKLEINKKRKWNKPTSDNPIEHDRSVDDIDPANGTASREQNSAGGERSEGQDNAG